MQRKMQSEPHAMRFNPSQSIVSGLHAASRIYHAATHEQIVKAACDLELKLRTGRIHMSDFDELEAA